MVRIGRPNNYSWVTISGMTLPSENPRSGIASDVRYVPGVAPFLLPPTVIDQLQSVGRRRKWRPGDVLVLCGSRIDFVTVCLSGSYRASLTSVDGHELLIRSMLQGEMYGIPSALAGAAFPVDVTCHEAGETMDVPRADFEQLLRREPELAMSVVLGMATRISEMFDLMEGDLLLSLRSRVYQRLLHLAQYNGTPDRTGRTQLTLRQSEIAQAVKASRQRVHMELKRMEREGLLELGYRRITLLAVDPPPQAERRGARPRPGAAR